MTIALTAIAGFGVGALYSSRQHYEDQLARAFEVKAAAGKLLAASVVEEATLRAASAERSSGGDARAQAAYVQALADTRRRAADDEQSLKLIDQAGAAQARLRRPQAPAGAALAARAPITALSHRQDVRLAAADDSARDDSRQALASITAAGGLALAGAIALVALLLAGVRRPLESLVDASARLAGGDLSARVDETAGPDELRQLGRSFNAMAVDLEEANERLEAERRRLAVTVRSLGDGLIIIDEEGLVAQANPRAARLAPDLQVGHPPEVGGLVLPAVDEALGVEVLLEHAGRTLAVTAARLEEHADGGVVWTLRDATERARLERLKSEFVATASHELRSPLTSIKGFVELLRAGEGLDERRREFLDIVLVSTNRLVDLVNDLLDVARLEAGGVEVHRRPVEVSEVLEEVITLLRGRMEAKHQHVNVDVAADTPRVLADATRLRQMLTNLVTNAHLYTDEGGTVTLRAGGLAAGGVRIEISDTGRGMSAAELEHVFERFSRGSGSTGTPGTGLGLSIVKSLVDLHGGTIDVASTPGDGTTFALTLPAAPRPGVVTRPSDALRGRRVLVLDDEPETARLIAERLEPFGVVCEIVHDGATALERLRNRDFDAMTLDVLMPGVSGFEVLRELRADPRLAELPVVVVSVFSGREALSGEWVISKPIDAEELADALGSAVMAGRVRVLAVGRPGVRTNLRRALDELAIEHEWASTPLEAARLCASRRFEVALVDAGLPDVEAAIAGLDLRGRRLRRSVVVVSADGDGVPGFARLDAEPIPVEEAGAAVLALLEPAPAADL
ncbi:MAG TPA: ATP-binding protein [Baekduia sp.]|nr:ATP-binding protein [Baekduia sp.]